MSWDGMVSREWETWLPCDKEMLDWINGVCCSDEWLKNDGHFLKIARVGHRAPWTLEPPSAAFETVKKKMTTTKTFSTLWPSWIDVLAIQS
jgi:hypothetical protein